MAGAYLRFTGGAAMMGSVPHDVLVVGGGPAGSMAAELLARAGRSVAVIERTGSPRHVVCGEFLSPESLPLLQKIGIDPEALGAQTIRRLRVMNRVVVGEIDLPQPARSLSRRTLDEALLQRARQEGACILRGCTVEKLERCKSLWTASVSDRTGGSLELQGCAAFLATGKHGLRGWGRDMRGTQSDLVAFKMYFALAGPAAADLAGHIELILFPGGYAGLAPVENGAVNLCALVTQKMFRALGSDWRKLLAHMKSNSPPLAYRLQDARPLLVRPLTLSRIPYGYCVPTSRERHQPWRIGDQAAVIPSFAGDGISIALYTAQRAAELYLNGADTCDLHAEIARAMRQRLTAAKWLSQTLVVMPWIARGIQLHPPLLAALFNSTRLPLVAEQCGGARDLQRLCAGL